MNNSTLLYDDFKIDFCFPPYRYSISATENNEFINLFSYSSLKAASGNDFGSQSQQVVRPVHPILVGSFQLQHAAFAWPTGVLHAKEKVTLTAPAYAGERLEARTRIKDKFIKNDKKFVVLEIKVDKLETNTTALTCERTLVWPK